jgi:hypothetical protein
MSFLAAPTSAMAAFFVNGVKVEAPRIDHSLRHQDGPNHYPPCSGMLDGVSSLRRLRDVPCLDAPLALHYDESVFMGDAIYGFRLLAAAFADVDARSSRPKTLVLGTGSGYEAIALAKRFSDMNIDATDINERAIHFTKANARNHGVGNQVRVMISDLFESVESNYDLIIFNAPRPIDSEASRHGDAKTQGFYDYGGFLLKRLLDGLSTHLSASGRLLLMTDEKLRYPLPAGLTDRMLSTDPWVEFDARNGMFSIHEISRVAR